MKSRRINRKSRKSRKGSGWFGLHKYKTWTDNKNNCKKYWSNELLPENDCPTGRSKFHNVDCNDTRQIDNYDFPSNKVWGVSYQQKNMKNIERIKDPYPGRDEKILYDPDICNIGNFSYRNDDPPIIIPSFSSSSGKNLPIPLDDNIQPPLDPFSFGGRSIRRSKRC